MSAGHEVFLDFPDIGNELTATSVFFIPLRVRTKAALDEFITNDLDQGIRVVGMLEDEAVAAFGERFGVLKFDHGASRCMH